MIPLFDLKAQYESIKPEIDAAVARVLQSGHYIGGDEVALFEHELAHKLQVKHAVTCASGTDALVLALRAAGVGPGDEVIMPAFSFWATAGAVLQVQAKPVFVDVSSLSLNIYVNDAIAAITPKTKAIIPVHLYGNPVTMRPLIRASEVADIKIIEDAAQAFGAYDVTLDKYAGTIGDMGCLSFFPTKPLGCAGDGGAVLTNNDDHASQLRMLKSHGWKQKYYPEILGYNSRLDAVQAAILRVKMQHTNDWLHRRIDIKNQYENAFSPIMCLTDRTESIPAHHLFNIMVNNRAEVMAKLKERWIETGVYYPQILPYCKPINEAHLGTYPKYPNAFYASNHILAIPYYAEMTDSEVTKVIEAVLEVVRGD